jgi:hypothetical protein
MEELEIVFDPLPTEALSRLIVGRPARCSQFGCDGPYDLLPARSREILHARAVGRGSNLGSVDSSTRWRVRGEDPPRRG